MSSRALLSAAALGLFLGGSVSRAADTGDRGTSTAAFLKLGPGAREAALGEAVTADPSGSTSLFWNPAGLALVRSPEASFMHAAHLDTVYFDHLTAAAPWRGQVLGLSGQFLSAGAITQRDESGVDVGSFSPQDLALTAGWARTVGGWPVGVGVKWIRSRISATDQTAAADLGLLTPALWGGRLRFGAAAQNLFGKLSFDQEAAPLPRTLKLGAALALSPRLKVSADIVRPNDNAGYRAWGVEYLLPEVGLALRAGYNARSSFDVEGVTGFTAGFGLELERWTLDYAVIPYGALGLTHRVSIGYRLGTEPSPAVELPTRALAPPPVVREAPRLELELPRVSTAPSVAPLAVSTAPIAAPAAVPMEPAVSASTAAVPTAAPLPSPVVPTAVSTPTAPAPLSGPLPPPASPVVPPAQEPAPPPADQPPLLPLP